MGTFLLWTFAIASAIAAGVGVVMLQGWLLFLVYNAVAPDTWFYLGFWPAIGISFLWTLFMGGSGRATALS